jgi:hypothetical protein
MESKNKGKEKSKTFTDCSKAKCNLMFRDKLGQCQGSTVGQQIMALPTQNNPKVYQLLGQPKPSSWFKS